MSTDHWRDGGLYNGFLCDCEMRAHRVLQSDWLAAHDREVAADALDTAADAFDVHGRSRGEAIAANTLRASATAIREGRTDA